MTNMKSSLLLLLIVPTTTCAAFVVRQLTLQGGSGTGTTMTAQHAFKPLTQLESFSPTLMKKDYRSTAGATTKQGSNNYSEGKAIAEHGKEGSGDLLRRPRNAMTRKKWGVDNVCADEYWFDKRIHTFGNVGLGGAIHAAMAPIATKIIDIKAYDGIDVRSEVSVCGTLGAANVLRGEYMNTY